MNDNSFAAWHPAGDGQDGRASPPIFNVPAAVKAVISALVAVQIILQLGGEAWIDWAFDGFALIPARWTLPGYPMLPGSEYWSLVTYMFLHGDWMHLTFNSLWLLIFGTPAARYLGTARFLLLCLASGVAGGLASLLLHWGENILVIGASGAVSGLLAAAIPIMYGWRLPGGAVPLPPRDLLSHPRALMFMLVWLAITLFSGGVGWTGQSFLTETAIAWEAHIGGFVGGLFAFYAIAPRRRRI
ncbi:MAG: rhomboid family intramembrane serine protease [Aestuariivirga sp.]|uniref:rhomboid family intramembrane serine protease n=1 Tax=Aestuariivirga sp. TaxID=2650926 RepID=UPI0038D20143